MALRMFGLRNEPAELWFNSSECVAPSPGPRAGGFLYMTPCNTVFIEAVGRWGGEEADGQRIAEGSPSTLQEAPYP